MELGIDSFAAVTVTSEERRAVESRQAINELLDRIELADKVGLDYFGVGEHHREEYLDSAQVVILAAAAARTQKIRLSSAVTVLSADDPVRVFQEYATLDLVSGGRAEIEVGRGSFIDAFPLFGYDLNDYNELFEEKLDLLLKIRENTRVTWEGQFRPALYDQPVYPRPLQKKIPIWIGVGGTPASFVRAGKLGLPLMVAVIGGETHRFRSLVDMYREAGVKAGHDLDSLKVGLHSLGYVARDSKQAIEDFYPGYARAFTRIGLERGWPPVTRSRFESQLGPRGAFLLGNPSEVAEKILRHSEALGGISRVTFQMDSAELSHEQLMEAIELMGTEVKPLLG
ncbi:LLM class flavin-dependent oxidoreductase [Xiashengella succiniciproducens]|uniref:LLM class flavin-dependent oxidoreductase n=1 Tax=Xiashengella succiniciproducens TaxID=2949635 RepID=A0A9J6ZP97_9BACT|nr:LLM class flavin-dependent oxidoreductase [Alkaliflexus sp. Ai-910]URW79740.1 LLM class flavin-dependent oxidoreductase [Alkaliflexus sp. Ai-910]